MQRVVGEGGGGVGTGVVLLKQYLIFFQRASILISTNLTYICRFYTEKTKYTIFHLEYQSKTLSRSIIFN